MSDVIFQPGDVVVLTGPGWHEREHDDVPVPLVGQVIVIERALWTDFSYAALGTFRLPGEGYEWNVWPRDEDDPESHSGFTGTIIHRPSLGQRGSAS